LEKRQDLLIIRDFFQSRYQCLGGILQRNQRLVAGSSHGYNDNFIRERCLGERQVLAHKASFLVFFGRNSAHVFLKKKRGVFSSFCRRVIIRFKDLMSTYSPGLSCVRMEQEKV